MAYTVQIAYFCIQILVIVSHNLKDLFGNGLILLVLLFVKLICVTINLRAPFVSLCFSFPSENVEICVFSSGFQWYVYENFAQDTPMFT